VECSVVTAVYAAVVIWTVAHHEPWRDEVVPLSIARRAHSLAELAAPLKFEGHPILWYLLLWLGYGLVHQTWILKAAGIGSAIGAVFLFNRSPLPWCLRYAFTFSFFPLYQYSVISRGYTLEMLLLFAFCRLYPRRHDHPVALAAILAALANTEAFGLIMTVAAGIMLVAGGISRRFEWRRALSNRSTLLATAVYLVGLVLATVVAFPASSHPLTGFQRLTFASIALGIGQAIVQPVAHAAGVATVPLPSAWVWAYFVYLTRRPPVLCFAALSLIGIEVLFNLVYGPGAPWHIGNVVLVLVAAMWLDASASTSTWAASPALERARGSLGRVLAVGVMVVLGGQVLLGAKHITTDLQYDYSENRRLAELLASDPALAGAVVMGEPDTPLWSLPYYADNRIYLARENVFRDWGNFAPPRPATYDLGALLEAARRVRGECTCPVVVTLGYELGELGTYTNFGGTQFEEHFVITAEARAEFVAATRPLARLRGPTMTDENYDVYVLR
jgi:hypothetical protein